MEIEGYGHGMTDGDTELTIRISAAEAALLGEDMGLPILLVRAMEGIIAIRSGQRPAGTSTTAGNWAELIKRTAMLGKCVQGTLEGEIRAHAAAGGSHGQLGGALGLARSTAQSQREVLLAKAPSPYEPQLAPAKVRKAAAA